MLWKKSVTSFFATVFSPRIQLSIWLIINGCLDEMAEVVSMEPRRKCQEKFLQLFFDGAISNFFLDSLVPPLNGFNAGIGAMVSVLFTHEIQCNGSVQSLDSGDACSGWVLGIHSMQKVTFGFGGFTQWPTVVWLYAWGHGWILGFTRFDSVRMVSGDSLNGFHVKVQCNVSVQRISVI